MVSRRRPDLHLRAARRPTPASPTTSAWPSAGRSRPPPRPRPAPTPGRTRWAPARSCSTRWERDNRLVVKKNPNYWQEGLPYLDEIVFRPIPDEDTRLSSLESGDIDVLQTLRQSTGIRARELDGVDNYEAPRQHHRRQHLQHHQAAARRRAGAPRPWCWPRTRSRPSRSRAAPASCPPSTQIFSQDDPYYSEEVAEAWPGYDPEAAQELIDEYVNDPSRSDGKAPGEPVGFRYDCLPEPVWSTWPRCTSRSGRRSASRSSCARSSRPPTSRRRCPATSRPSASGPASTGIRTPRCGTPSRLPSPLNFTRFTDPTIDTGPGRAGRLGRPRRAAGAGRGDLDDGQRELPAAATTGARWPCWPRGTT